MRKQIIPKALKISVWNKYIGEEIGKAKCLCCNITDITQQKKSVIFYLISYYKKKKYFVI